MNIKKLIHKAKSSSLYLYLLNYGLNKLVPFNKPHGFKIIELSDHHIRTMVPYRKSNFNHIKGIHACALATLSEFTTGFLLLTKLDPKKYRLIMSHISVEYHYQARMNVFADFSITPEWLNKSIVQPLRSAGKVNINCEVKIFDRDRNHISTGKVHWQIKSWEQVRTKM